MRTLILGAGISGLSAGYALNQIPGESCAIYEKDPVTGGLCQTTTLDGFTFDSVSHVLHFRWREAEHLVRNLLHGNLARHDRSSWIYFRGRYVPYPFQTHLGFLPFRERTSCLLGYLKTRAAHPNGPPKNPANFEEWIHSRFGAGIGRHFMTPYNTKLWGVPPLEMSTDWVRPFVPTVSAAQIVGSLLLKNTKSLGYNPYFLYPERAGIQALVDGLAANVPDIHLNRRVVAVDLERKSVRFQPELEVTYERLISTIPLRSFVQLAVGLPEELRQIGAELQCTSLLNLTYCIGHPLPHAYHWVYFSEPEFPFFRLVFPSNVSPSSAPPNCSIISAEVSRPAMDRVDELDKTIREILRGLGLIKNHQDIIRISRKYLEYAYPVHDLGRQSHVARLRDYLRSQGAWSIGRFGGWRYSSIDDAIVEALQTARAIAQPATEERARTSVAPRIH